MTAYKKPPTAKRLPKRPRPLLESFALLFYVCKIFGINSEDLQEFRKFKQLKKSSTGEGIVIINMIILFINFNLMIGVFQTGTYIDENTNLAIAVGFVLTYYSLLMILADGVTGLVKQNSFAEIFHEMLEIDEEFLALGIIFNNNAIKYRIFFVILSTGLIELLLLIMTFVLYVEFQNWTALLWIYSGIPTYLNTVHKLWYGGILLAIRKRFEAINQAFEEESLRLKRQNEKKQSNKKTLKKEKTFKFKHNFKNQIKPALNNNVNNIFGDVVCNSPILTTSFDTSFSAFTSRTNSSNSSSRSYVTNTPVSFANLEERFVKLCQLHDGLCQVGKRLNNVFGFPILMLMGYGFVIITAQLYFLYCARVNETVPTLFRSAENWWITGIYIFYIGFKCVSILYVNWKTTLEAKKTGVCIHRCALAADQNKFYEMINHLSLKLFNHVLEFNACGYFPLTMSTLFSFCGGISTYLIILIQFNLEEQQVKVNSENGKPMALTLNGSSAGVNMTLLEYAVNDTESAGSNVTTLFDVLQLFWNSYYKSLI